MKGKPLFTASVLLNIVFLLGALVAWRQARVTAPVNQENERPSVQSVTVAPVGPGESLAPLKTFHWSLVESADDATYVRNLRAIGCPERTVHDIVAAAVGHRFDEKREALEAQRTKKELSADEWQAAVAKSWEDQNDLMSRLFGAPASFGRDGLVEQRSRPRVPGEPETEEERHERVIAGMSTLSAPIVFAEPDPAWGLGENEASVWNQIYDQFVNKVRLAPDQNPKAIAYLRNWQEAQVAADEALKQALGDTRYVELQLRVQSRMPPPPGSR